MIDPRRCEVSVNSLHHFLAVDNRRFLEGLTCTEFFDNAGALVFTFEFFESFLDVFAFFYLYDDHLC